MDSPDLDRVVRIKTNSCRSGVIENIFCRNIEVGQCNEAVLKINLLYERKEACDHSYPPRGAGRISREYHLQRKQVGHHDRRL